MILSLIFVIAAVSYAVLILGFTAGWMRLPVFWHSNNSGVSFSVIIPARNEEKHIMPLLILLRNQHFPKDQYEVIVVDDHSSDATARIVEQKIASGYLSNVRLIKAADINGVRGKKNALTIGIEQARFNWIITSDSDCKMGRHWLQAISGFIEQQKPDMVIGQVAITPGASLFSQMQALEFMSLSGSSAGAAALGKPIMCSGANLAFRKDQFERVGGYIGNEQFASGDDMFLLQKFKKLPGVKIAFLKSHGAIVYTRAVSEIRDFFRQRGRWAGKAGGYKDAFTMLTAFAVVMINLLIVTGIFGGSLFSETVLLNALLLLVFKALVDFPLLFSVSGFFEKRDMLWLYPALSIAYPFYVLVSLIAGFSLKPSWKS
jgi:poly-beta-1,6-N-acetyl-D-glucosamine synthase